MHGKEHEFRLGVGVGVSGRVAPFIGVSTAKLTVLIFQTAAGNRIIRTFLAAHPAEGGVKAVLKSQHSRCNPSIFFTVLFTVDGRPGWRAAQP